MFPYNTGAVYRDNYNGDFVIKSDGNPTGYEDIRAMIVIQVKDNDTQMPVNLLIAAGEKGRVASCNLSTGVWCHYDGTKGDTLARIYNNGSAMGSSTIYCISSYTDISTPDKISIIYGGGDGRISCTVRSAMGTVTWFGYDSNNIEAGVITNDGAAMGYKAILSMTNYLNNILFLAGVIGHIATCKLATRQFTNFDAGTGIHSDGEVVGGVSVYASAIINSVYVAAGENGRVANYDIAKGIWTPYDRIGLASEGSVVDHKNINAIETHDNYVIFGSDDGLVASYNVFTNEWTPYNAKNGIRNNGEFIKSSISGIIKYNSVIYFTGKAGNVIFKYRAGDIIVDENGKFIIEKPSELQGIIKALPVYDRIYAMKSGYFDILKGYNEMIAGVDSLSAKFPQGCKLTIGIKNTSGRSSTFRFINIKTREEEFLDNLSLSLSLGVKFDSNLTADDKRYLVNEIVIEARKYILEIQESTVETVVRLNFNTMLDVIKTRVPNIVYFEIYSINNYDANVCQTIFWKKDIIDTTVLADEYLSVKNNVDESASDIANQTVVFKPAIDVILL
jgi:hypothetical protein